MLFLCVFGSVFVAEVLRFRGFSFERVSFQVNLSFLFSFLFPHWLVEIQLSGCCIILAICLCSKLWLSETYQ